LCPYCALGATRLLLLRRIQVLGEFLDPGAKVCFVRDVVTIENCARFVAGQLHRQLLVDPGTYEIPHRCPAKVVNDPTKQLRPNNRERTGCVMSNSAKRLVSRGKGGLKLLNHAFGSIRRAMEYAGVTPRARGKPAR
jgi:hypothetical protein